MTAAGDPARHTDFFVGASVPKPPIADDDGAAAPGLLLALQQLALTQGGTTDVLDALSSARLFVPVVAILDEDTTGADGVRREKASSMATVLVDSREHGRAQLAFSSIEALSAWSRDARPVALMAPLAARAAVGDSADSLLVDVAGPVPFALTGTELLLMASLAGPADLASDPVAHRALAQHLERYQAVQSAQLAAATGSGAAVEPALLTLRVHGQASGGPPGDWSTQLAADLAADPVLRALMPGGLRISLVAD